jgi:hypothetical protein
MTKIRVGRIVVHSHDARAARHLAENLPQALRHELASRDPGVPRDVERAIRDAARKARG